MTMPTWDRPPSDMRTLVEGVADDQLGLPTPCPDYTVADLLDHIDTLSIAFVAAATQDERGGGTRPPPGDAARLGDGLADAHPRRPRRLADAWRDPEAWTGMTVTAAVETPGEVAGLIGLDELVVHGWDIARSTGQELECDDDVARSLPPSARDVPEPGKVGRAGRTVRHRGRRPGRRAAAGPGLGLSGRDPAWTRLEPPERIGDRGPASAPETQRARAGPRTG